MAQLVLTLAGGVLGGGGAGGLGQLGRADRQAREVALAAPRAVGRHRDQHGRRHGAAPRKETAGKGTAVAAVMRPLYTGPAAAPTRAFPSATFGPSLRADWRSGISWT